MKALSIMQPWASLIVGWRDDAGGWHDGPKDIENRSWRPAAALIGQRVAIHASKREDDSVGASIHGAAHIYNCGTTKLPSSAILGVATIYSVVASRAEAIDRGIKIMGEDEGGWYTGDIGLVLVDRRALAKPVPCKGALGFWPLPADVERAVNEQLDLCPHCGTADECLCDDRIGARP